MGSRLRTSVVGVVAVSALVFTAACSQHTSGAVSGSVTSSGSSVSSHKYKVAFVPKYVNGFFAAMDAGGKQAAKDLGFDWLYQGSTTADAAAQADIVRSFIQQKVDALIVAPNDPESMAPVLKQASAAGIKVLTADTDSTPDSRSVFVNQASDESIGHAVTDALMKAMGGKGNYAIVSCGQTAQNLNSWIAIQKSYTASKYPDAHVVDVVYAGSDQTKATSMATDLMNAHPDLTGLVGECVPTAPAVAQAVQNAGKVGKVFTVGVGLPQAMKPYVDAGSSSASILWNVNNLGYLAGWAALQLVEGKQFQPTNNVSASLPSVTFDQSSGQLIMGEPLTLTKTNIGDYNY